MKEAIEKIFEWNYIAENLKYNKHLEVSMLSEEFAETISAISRWDKVEILDWILDMFIVWMWTLCKMGFDMNNVNEAFDRIMENNYSKFKKWDYWYYVEKDENWKILKPEWFKPVDLSDLIP